MSTDTINITNYTQKKLNTISFERGPQPTDHKPTGPQPTHHYKHTETE